MNSDARIKGLVLRCQLGERDAFEELFRQFQPRLRYYVRRLDEQSANNAEDLLQDIWVKVIRGIGSLRDPEAFVTWLYRIARNQVCDHTRASVMLREFREEAVEQAAVDDERVFNEDEADRIHRALAKLKPHQREILTLSFLEEMSPTEIAEVLGCSRGTVRSRLYYARQALRKELETDDG